MCCINFRFRMASKQIFVEQMGKFEITISRLEGNQYVEIIRYVVIQLYSRKIDLFFWIVIVCRQVFYSKCIQTLAAKQLYEKIQTGILHK